MSLQSNCRSIQRRRLSKRTGQRRRLLLESLEAKCMLAGDGLDFATDLSSSAEEVGELIELQLGATRDGQSLLNSNREFTAAVGERFDLEVRYDDLRTFDAAIGAFSVYTDIASSLPDTVRPVVSETQRLELINVVNATGGDLVFSVEGSTSTHTVSFTDFADDPSDALEAALTALQLPEFSLSEYPLTSDDDRGYEIRFTGEDAKFADIGNVSVDVSQLTGPTVTSETIEIPALLESGRVNPDAIPFNLEFANPTFNDGQEFYRNVPLGTLSETDFLVEVGGTGLVASASGGIPTLTNDGGFIQPFFVFSIEIEVVDVASEVEFAVTPADIDESILLYGLNEPVSPDMVLIDEDASFVAMFTSSSANQTNPVQPEDVNADGAVTPLDALLVVNRIFVHGDLPDSNGPNFYDVNADGQLTAVDANRVITYLGSQSDDFNLVDTPGLIALNLDVQRDGDSILPSDGTLELAVGERFDLTVNYEDLRTFNDRIGAFSIFTDIATNKPETFRPVVSETQQLIFSRALLEDPDTTAIAFGHETLTISYEVPINDFANDPVGSIQLAADELGIADFEVTTMTLPNDDVGYQLRFVDPFQDFANLTGLVLNTSSGTHPVTSVVIPALIGDNVNPDALKFNIKTESSTFNNGESFYRVTDTAEYDISGDSVFNEVGGIGLIPSQGGGIPQLTDDGSFASPFDAFSIEIEVLSAADDVVFEIDPADRPENQIVLYGIDNHLAADQLATGNGFRVELDFVSEDSLNAANSTLNVDEDSEGSIDLATLVTGGVADSFEVTVNGELGTSSVSGSTFTYVPNANQFGMDTVVYRATNAEGTDTGTISISIASINDPPVANTDQVTTSPSTALEINVADLIANDRAAPEEAGDTEDDQVLSITEVSTDNQNVSVELINDVVVLTPDEGFTGDGVFVYTLSDGIDTVQSTVEFVVELPFEPVVFELESSSNLSLIVRSNGDNLEIHDDLLDQLLLSRPIESTENLTVNLSGDGSHQIQLVDGSGLTFPVELNVDGGGSDRLIVADSNSELIEIDATQASRVSDGITLEHPDVDFSDFTDAFGFESLTIETVQQITFASDLGIGEDTLILNSELPIDLPQLTTIDGGTLASSSTIALSSGHSLIASGTVDGRVAAEVGSLIQATGDLLMGDPNSLAGFETRGDLEVGNNTVELLDENQAAIGALTSLGAALGTDDASAGTIVSANGLIVDFAGNVSGFGTLDTPNDQSIVLLNNGEFIGESATNGLTLTGYVKGVGAFDNVTMDGTFDPGLSPAIIDNGSVTYGENSQIIIELGGILAGEGYDQINHSEIATLAGTLAVELIEGFAPSGGETYSIVTAAQSLINELSDLQLPSLAEGLQWIVDQTGNEILLEVGVDIGQLSGKLEVEVVDGKLVVRDGDGAVIPTGGNSLRIDVNPTDEFTNTAGFQVMETEVIEGELVQKVASGDVTMEIVGSDWTNFVSPADVDGSGEITARDALLIVNNLARELFFVSDDFTLIDPAVVAEFPGTFFDVSGDGRATALDALRVINRLATVDASGESEQLPLVGNDRLAAEGSTDDIPSADQVATTIAGRSPQTIASFGFAAEEQAIDSIMAGLVANETEGDDAIDEIDDLAIGIASLN